MATAVILSTVFLILAVAIVVAARMGKHQPASQTANHY
jgi:hypothetical protein